MVIYNPVTAENKAGVRALMDSAIEEQLTGRIEEVSSTSAWRFEKSTLNPVLTFGWALSNG
jgi:hypothetical protein